MTRGNNSQVINASLDGLNIHSNQFSEVSRGSLRLADNLVLRRESLGAPRRGLVDISNRASTGLTEFSLAGLGSGVTDHLTDIFEYQGQLIIQAEDGGLFFYDDVANEWKSVDTAITPKNPSVSNGYFVNVLEADQNLYFTSETGIFKIDTVDEGIARLAGMPRALDGLGILVDASGFMPDNSAVAYRIVWGNTDLNNNLILGAPSQRIIISNTTGGTRNVELTFTIPAGITETDFYQVYRSPRSATAEDEPNDELQLVFEAFPDAGQLTAGEVMITDIVPDSFRGADLYTNATQEGIQNANDRPPASLILEEFRGNVFYGVAIPDAVLNVQVIAVGATEGLQIGDTVEFFLDDPAVPTSIIFTGAVTEDAVQREFAIVTSNISPGQNIIDTTTSLVRVINKHFSGLEVNIRAFYNQDPGEDPGQFALEGGTGTFEFRRFAFGVSRKSAFLDGPSFFTSQGAPTLQTPYSKSTLADFDAAMSLDYKNVIQTVEANVFYVSKFSQAEAVPVSNRFTVGTSGDPILAIVASRDKVFIFKKKEGVFRVTGDILFDGRTDLHDNTIRIIGPRTAARVSNQVFLLSDQGVISVTNSGTVIMSRGIEIELNKLIGSADNATLLPQIFATGYETQNEYILSMPDGIPINDEPITTKQFVYNIITNAWTTWSLLQDSSAVIDSKFIYAGKNINGQNTLFEERKGFNSNDFADEETTVNISAVAPDGVTLTVDTTINFRKGWKFEQRQGSTLKVRANVLTIVDATTVVVDVPLTGSFQTGDSFVFEPIAVSIQWAPETGGNQAMMKRFNEYTFTFEAANFPSGNLSLQSSDSTGRITTPLIPIFFQLSEGWGNSAWGQSSWGGNVGATFIQNIRVLSPPTQRLGQWVDIRLDFNEALTDFLIAGYSLTFRELSTRRR